MEKNYDTYLHQLEYCPSCSMQMNASSTLESSGPPPKAEDLSICAYCGALNMFMPVDGILKMVPATEKVIKEYKKEDPEGYIKMMFSSEHFRKNHERRKKYN